MTKSLDCGLVKGLIMTNKTNSIIDVCVSKGCKCEIEWINSVEVLMVYNKYVDRQLIIYQKNNELHSIFGVYGEFTGTLPFTILQLEKLIDLTCNSHVFINKDPRTKQIVMKLTSVDSVGLCNINPLATYSLKDHIEFDATLNNDFHFRIKLASDINDKRNKLSA